MKRVKSSIEDACIKRFVQYFVVKFWLLNLEIASYSVLKTINHYSSAHSLSDVKCSHTFILPFITDKGKNRKETKKG